MTYVVDGNRPMCVHGNINVPIYLSQVNDYLMRWQTVSILHSFIFSEVFNRVCLSVHMGSPIPIPVLLDLFKLVHLGTFTLTFTHLWASGQMVSD